jgi:protocatechuate 3,4-dioxygenase beta subunit
MGCLKHPSVLICVVAVAGVLAAPATPAPAANRCSPTPTDGFGPFGRGEPPVRTKIGTGHVLAGVVLSALDCRPVRGARVNLWQSNAKGRYTLATSATVITDSSGRFRFQGPYPASYEGRPAHSHLRVLAPDPVPLLARSEPRPGARRGSLRLVLAPDAL